MPPAATLMRQEVLEFPTALERLLTSGDAGKTRAADALKQRNPDFIISIARGSSDHVATYFKYASELLLGVPVASVGLSVASVYARPLRLKNAASLSVSQSGKSPDIVEATRMAQSAGALALALTNAPTSPPRPSRRSRPQSTCRIRAERRGNQNLRHLRDQRHLAPRAMGHPNLCPSLIGSRLTDLVWLNADHRPTSLT